MILVAITSEKNPKKFSEILNKLNEDQNGLSSCFKKTNLLFPPHLGPP